MGAFLHSVVRFALSGARSRFAQAFVARVSGSLIASSLRYGVAAQRLGCVGHVSVEYIGERLTESTVACAKMQSKYAVQP
jgi:hypothetical protein